MVTAAAETGVTQAATHNEQTSLGLGRDAFLQLLITQIQTQDPLEPLSAREFVAQLAQFSTVEQLQAANLQLAILHQVEATSQALALIGRSISTADGKTAGLVSAVVFTDGQPKLVVGDAEVDPGDVARVW
jgi:flagellar basal-body rod modification protein FlgD